jgi:hypothetical protein
MLHGAAHRFDDWTVAFFSSSTVTPTVSNTLFTHFPFDSVIS